MEAVKYDLWFLNFSLLRALWIMDLGEGREISKSSNQVIDKGGLNKGDRNSGEGSDVRHVCMVEPEGLAAGLNKGCE